MICNEHNDVCYELRKQQNKLASFIIVVAVVVCADLQTNTQTYCQTTHF